MIPGLGMRDWEPSKIEARPRRPRTRSGEYAGAIIDRLQNFISGLQSEDQEIKGNLDQLRAHSRELTRNNVWMRRFFKLVGQETVGDSGVTMQADIRIANDTPKKSANDIIESAWREWARPGVGCMDGRSSWVDMQLATIRGTARDGEIFWRKVRGKEAGNRFGFALQPLDPDLLDVTFDWPGVKGQNAVVMGVEIDSYNRPVAYHFWTAHPSDYGRNRKRIRIPAAEVVHFFSPNRVNQTRGVPWSVAAMWMLKMVGAYTEAEIAAARAESERLGFIENQLDDGEAPPESSGTSNPLPVTLPSQSASYYELPAGKTVNLPDVKHPTTAFAAFVTEMLRGIATGLNVSYHAITGDLSSANYSSLRQGALGDHDGWRECQRMLIEHFCQPVFSEWLDMAILSGAVSIAARDLEQARYPRWEPRGWDWVDPLKDSKASIMDIEAGLDTRTRVCAERGRNFEEIARRLAEEKDLIGALGLNLSTVKDPEVAVQDVTDGQPTSASGGKQNAA